MSLLTCDEAEKRDEWNNAVTFQAVRARVLFPFISVCYRFDHHDRKRITWSRSLYLYIFQITVLQDKTREKDTHRSSKTERFSVIILYIRTSNFVTRYPFAFSLGEMKTTKRKAQVYYKIMPHRTSNWNHIKESRPLKSLSTQFCNNK